MPDPRHRFYPAACLCALGCLLAACDPSPPAAKPHAFSPELAAARVDLAKSRLTHNAPAEALALLVSALEADPTSVESHATAAGILAKTRWHLPETTIRHPLPVDRIHFASPSSVWVSLNGASNTTVRWDLESLDIKSVLFPLPATETRSFILAPGQRSAVIERAGVLLLCDAQSLKPVRDLGPLPGFVTPTSTIAFSADGLLLAHPVHSTEASGSLTWHLRDATTGEIIRSTTTPEHPHPLAAFLDRGNLRILHADASVLEIPVSPVEEIRTSPPAAATTLLHAVFSSSGHQALALQSRGPHLDPESILIPPSTEPDTSLTPAALLARFPWSKHPGIWTGLLRTNTVTAPATDSPVTAIASSPSHLVTGEQNGTLTIHRTLPLPKEIPGTQDSATPSSTHTLRQLSEGLAGLRYESNTRTFTHIPADQRLAALRACDATELRTLFPQLDFTPLLESLPTIQFRSAAAESLLPLTDRLARAGKPLPDAQPLIDQIEQAFDSADDAAVLSAIESAGPNGPAAAKALELALATTHPEWIEACLKSAGNLPPLIRKLATSRIAWLQDRKADAIAGWPDRFPLLREVRLREDWDGWEQADFSIALESLKLCVREELDAIKVPAGSTPEQRQAVAARLADPKTLRAVGRARFARACLDAALAFSSFPGETATTLVLAARARELGEAPAPCLRAEAMALTALGQYRQAHERWISLITDHPLAAQEPGDYAEASYTAFENADPRQAMAILTTGLHRFPNDAHFALRAGWVALLTGNSERAYRFLLTGRQIGYPPGKLENATLLLAIAAYQTGAAEDAAVFYQDLIAADKAWENPSTIDSLEWPEELKAPLRDLLAAHAPAAP